MNPDVERSAFLAREPESNGDEPRHLGDLIDQIVALLQRHVRLPDPALADLLAMWISGTYIFQRFMYYGYVALRSATPRCGKSRLLRLISLLANGNPPIQTVPTPAVLFRRTRPVTILDEVDRLRNADKERFGEVFAVLNAGFERGGVVERMERKKGGEFEIRTFDVYGPKALAGVESLADTLADRAFIIQMERTPDRMPRLNLRRLGPVCAALRADLKAWAAYHGEAVATAYDGLPDEVPDLAGFDDRFQDLAEPLMVLAACADAERPEAPSVMPRLLAGLRVAARRREPSSRECQLLAFLDIVESRLEGRDEVFVKTGDLIGLCQEREELSHLETGKALAAFLRHFDLRPRRNAGNTERGYLVTQVWIAEWRSRYRQSEAREP